MNFIVKKTPRTQQRLPEQPHLQVNNHFSKKIIFVLWNQSC
jgi:hypothetical protein